MNSPKTTLSEVMALAFSSTADFRPFRAYFMCSSLSALRFASASSWNCVCFSCFISSSDFSCLMLVDIESPTLRKEQIRVTPRVVNARISRFSLESVF